MFSLRDTLTSISSQGGLPPGFSASDGIRVLFPSSSFPVGISKLANYHFLWQDSRKALGTTCNLTVDAWGGGQWRFSGTLGNQDFASAQYGVGFLFKYAPNGVGGGDVATGTIDPRGSGSFDHSGHEQWLADNWLEAFSAGVMDDLKVSENVGDVVLGIMAILGDIGLAIVEAAAFIILGGYVEFNIWSSTHAIYIDPDNRDVWIGPR
jgi:hypothetical protein